MTDETAPPPPVRRSRRRRITLDDIRVGEEGARNARSAEASNRRAVAAPEKAREQRRDREIRDFFRDEMRRW
jgi:hypothetical protein